MESPMKYLVAILVALIFAAAYACVNRYSTQSINPDSAGVMLLDRWTGEICFVGMSVYTCHSRDQRTLEKISN
jgi:hypothetical protein